MSASSSDAGLHMRMSEVEFLAEEQLVEIIPNFEAGVFSFIGGDIGPFRPQRPISVPIWLAVTLRNRQKCIVNAPEWMSKESLLEKRDEEKESVFFTRMPDHYQEVAAMLLECAAADVRDSESVRGLLADVHDIRYSKMRKGLSDMKDSEAVKLNNLSLMEISSIRPFFVESMDAFFKLYRANEESNAAT
eukprot:m.105176 g.105176  ORF g.105176 m.105176 type:complete len:190 (+) comp27626_c0_seq1:78-647(+)